MAFKLTQVQVDVLNGLATVVAVDQPASGPPKVVSAQFPFKPPGAEAQEQGRVVAEAKRILQQALNEI